MVATAAVSPRRRRESVRGTWLTSVLGLVLLIGLPIVLVTGLLTNAAYDPRLGANVAMQGRSLSPFDFYLFNWPTHPAWLFAANQGTHTALGLALIPVVVMKLWSAIPGIVKPIRGVAEALERASLVVLIAAIVFEIGTGLLYIEYWWPFGFNFAAYHYYGAWAFLFAFVIHASVKLPTMRQALRTRRAVITGASQPDTQVPRSPASPELVVIRAGGAHTEEAGSTLSRRGLLGTVAAGSALLGLQGAGEAIGGPLRGLAFMLPQGETLGSGPNGFNVDGTFASLGLSATTFTSNWRLALRSTTGFARDYTRDQLLALPQHTYRLTLACEEGWSTTQTWTGVRLRDLAAIAGIDRQPVVTVHSVDGYQVAFAPNQVLADESLLALGVNGVPLSLDHGYPARVMIPAVVGMNCLKWITQMSVNPATGAE